ncbi:MAG: chaperone NapD [Rhodoferax sp.]
MNISSAIVYAHPDHATAVHQLLLEQPGVEVHTAGADGKLVITLECDDDQMAVRRYESIGQMNGVLTLSMVYQQSESHPDQEV